MYRTCCPLNTLDVDSDLGGIGEVGPFDSDAFSYTSGVTAAVLNVALRAFVMREEETPLICGCYIIFMGCYNYYINIIVAGNNIV
jgi:hypothetical protein